MLPHNFFAGGYLFVYDFDHNNTIVLIQPNSESADSTEADTPDGEVVGTMRDDMM